MVDWKKDTTSPHIKVPVDPRTPGGGQPGQLFYGDCGCLNCVVYAIVQFGPAMFSGGYLGGPSHLCAFPGFAGISGYTYTLYHQSFVCPSTDLPPWLVDTAGLWQIVGSPYGPGTGFDAIPPVRSVDTTGGYTGAIPNMARLVNAKFTHGACGFTVPPPFVAPGGGCATAVIDNAAYLTSIGHAVGFVPYDLRFDPTLIRTVLAPYYDPQTCGYYNDGAGIPC